MVNGVAVCWLRHGTWWGTEQHQRDFVMCMDRAVDAYKPIKEIEYMLATTIHCIETPTSGTTSRSRRS